MKSFLLSPVLALHDAVFYRTAVHTWRPGKTFLFLLYIAFFYAFASEMALIRMANEFMGPLDDDHVITRFLNEAPFEWRFTEDGLRMQDENGTPVEQWNFAQWVYVDTTQEGDFMPPGEYQIVMSKTLLWAPGGGDGTARRFREWRNQANSDITIYIYRNRDGFFDHLEIVGGEGERMVTRADLERTLGTFKMVGLTIAFVILWPLLLIFKAIGALVLSLFGLLFNAMAGRGLRYGQIFIVSLLAQSWVLVIDLITTVLPMLAPVRTALSLAVTVAFVWLVIFRFLVSAEEKPPSEIPPTV